jgi:hypothetical protein
MQAGTLDLKTIKMMVKAQKLMVKGNVYRPGALRWSLVTTVSQEGE